MKKHFWLAGLLIFRGCTPVLCPAQNVEGQIIASQYGAFRLNGTSTNSFVFSPAACQVTAGSTNFSAVTQDVPVRVVDPGNHALDETVAAGLVDINACSVQLAISNTHVPPFYVTSGTAGLQEAINANSKGIPNTIILSADWYELGGSSAIVSSVTGTTSLGLVDVTTTPFTWYQWDGAAYEKVSTGGGNPSGTAGSLQYNNAGSFGGASITGIVKGNSVNPPSAAIAGIDYQAPLGYAPANIADNLSDLVSASSARANLGLSNSSEIASILNASPSTQLASVLIPTLNQNTTGNAATATALAATPSQCSGLQYATGIASNGNAACAIPAAGVPSVNGVTAATTIAAGSNITVSTAGSTVTVAAAGGAGTGAVGAGSQYQDTTYPNAGSTTTVGAIANKYTLPAGLATSQLDSWFSGLSTGTATIQNGDGATPFANPNFVGVQDLREIYPVADWNVKESGAQCDLQGGFGSLTKGSTALTITDGYSLSAADVGKYIEMVGYDTDTSLPSRFDPTITAVTDSTHATLSTAAPFTVSEYSMNIGHRDDAAIASAFGHFTYRRPISFPTGNCWSDTIAVYGQSFHGNGAASMVTGLAGDDVFASLDPTNGGFQSMGSNNEIYGMTWNFDPRINAAQPWEDVSANGTVTAHAASYRPVGLFTVWANYPLGPGWIQGPGANNTGATNGVAATTQNSALICIPTSETEPLVGQEIIFPYFASIFTSTVSSLSGSECAAGTNPLTMAAALPNTSGYTTTQSEWMSGTSVQTIDTAIPSGTRATVSITAYSITSNVVTFTATNSYSAGQIVNISGFATSTFLNSAALTVLSSGLSGSQFEADFTHANASATESGSASIFPFTLDLANNINPPLTVNVANTASNVAPYGLVQIDGEQCSYFSDSSYPATTSATYWIKLTACAQNGTSAASHSIGATIVPLNPFESAWPWPVTPSLNAGVMPENASYFPAWDIGNAGWAQPTYDGADWSAAAALSFSNMHDITIQQNVFYAGSGGGTEGGPNAFQMSNATAGMYIVPLPYKATFKNIHIIDPQFGIFEGTPSINTYGMWTAYPTADGSTWQNITIQSAGFDTLFTGGQSDTKRDFLTFCQNGGETGNSWPGQPLGAVGCGAAWIWGGTYDDKDGGGGSNNTHATLENWYVEPEDPAGGQAELQPYFEFNCGECTYRINPFGGGVTFIEGAENNFINMQLVGGQASLPILNYGYTTTMNNVAGVGLGPIGNTYGSYPFLNYGPNASIVGQTDATAGPLGSLASGNSLTKITGQTADTFITGNDTNPYVSSSSAMLYPDQFNANSSAEANPMSIGWTFDDSAPVSHSYAACNTTDSGGCNTHIFNGTYFPIGPGQKLVPGKYIAHYALRTKGGANTLNFQIGATNVGPSCAAATVYNANVTTSSTWTGYATGPLDFTGTGGCGLQVWFNGTTTSDQVQIAYLVFTPVWTTVTLPVTTPADNSACTPGAFLGSDSSYLYICTASGAVKRAALSAY